MAAITPTSDATAITEAIEAEGNPGGVIVGSEFTNLPGGNPAAVSDTPLTLFPLRGGSYGMLSSGDTKNADDPNTSESTSTDNFGGGGGHSGPVFDLVTLRVALNVPASVNCLTFDYRFLTEEFAEFVGSEFNDSFLAEIDISDFSIAANGEVTALNNIAIGADGKITTVNTAGTSASNALGTTYDGATPILRATTPITPGPHSLYLSVYDASDHIYDSIAFIDNLRVRNVAPQDCKRGSATSPNEGKRCQGKPTTVVASGGVATGTQGDDVIRGSAKDDVIIGRGGDDVICGGRGDDEIEGRGGEDSIVGNGGKDKIKGNSGGDTLRGAKGNDQIDGHKGNDKLLGGKGDDDLDGGKGNDNCPSGAGNDIRHRC